MAIGGHHSANPGSETWLSPLEIVRALGRFDLDPCAYPAWPTAEQGYHWPAQDGLVLPWFGRVWLNPPYTSGAIAQWMRRMAEHDSGVALIFARTETSTFFRHVWESASACLFFEGRLHFHLPDGTRAKANAGAPSVLVGYGPEELDALEACGLKGQFVPLRFPRSWLLAPESWREVVLAVLRRRRGPVALAELYAEVRNHPITRANPNWRAKVRQTLRRARCRRVGPARYTE